LYGKFTQDKIYHIFYQNRLSFVEDMKLILVYFSVHGVFTMSITFIVIIYNVSYIFIVIILNVHVPLSWSISTLNFDSL